MRSPRVFIGILAAVIAVLACTSPLAVGTLQPPATGVALTLQAMASETALALPVPSPTPAALPPLSRPLYFLDDDGAGNAQILRLEADGHTVQQITFEPLSVDSYDVSRRDGRIAYTSNNELFLVVHPR